MRDIRDALDVGRVFLHASHISHNVASIIICVGNRCNRLRKGSLEKKNS